MDLDFEIDYEELMSIDEDSLDVEWLEQPKKMVQMVKIAANCERELNKTKDKLAQVKADLSRDIRANPDKFGLDKVTENAIFEKVQTHKDYIEAFNDFVDAQYEAQVAAGSVKAMEQRKSALENLVKLHGQQYFAGPKVPRDLSSVVSEFREKQKAKKEARIKIGKSMKRNKIERTR